MEAYIAAHNLYSVTRHGFCSGVVFRAEERKAMADTMRLGNTLSKNQWFRALLPDASRFLDLGIEMKIQPGYALERLGSQGALSILFVSEGAEFMRQLDAYLDSNDFENREEEAQAEVREFYAEKRREILAMSAPEYLGFVAGKTAGRDPLKVSAYLCHFGIAGLSFVTSSGPSFLLFNPRRDIIIKEIKRSLLKDAPLAS
jgi:hypothetical protein